MTLTDRLIAYITKKGLVDYDTLEKKATEAGYTPLDFEQAIEAVHRGKKVQQKVFQGKLVYSLVAPKVAKGPGSHLSWVRHNYPKMDSSNDGSGIEADFSYLFLSPEELIEYKAAASGRPTYMVKSKYGNS